MIVAGFGFRGAATAQSLSDALARACAAGAPDIAALAAPADKAATPAFTQFAERCALPICPIAPQALAAQDTQTQSPRIIEARAAGSVAEAAALAALQPGGALLAPRVISNDRLATCALAQGDAL